MSRTIIYHPYLRQSQAYFLFGRKLIDLSGVSTNLQQIFLHGRRVMPAIHPRSLHRLPMTEMSNSIGHHGSDLPLGSPLSSFASCRRPQALRVSNFVTLRPDQWCYHFVSLHALTFVISGQLLSTEMQSRFHDSEPMVASWAEVHVRRELANDKRFLRTGHESAAMAYWTMQ
jgi:hypothetical protein